MLAKAARDVFSDRKLYLPAMRHCSSTVLVGSACEDVGFCLDYGLLHCGIIPNPHRHHCSLFADCNSNALGDKCMYLLTTNAFEMHSKMHSCHNAFGQNALAPYALFLNASAMHVKCIAAIMHLGQMHYGHMHYFSMHLRCI